MADKPIERAESGQADLFWDAFQYVGDEMTPPVRDAFEARLGEDQSAREAVGQVVHLAQLVDAAEESRPMVERVGLVTPASTASKSWMQPVGWVAVGAAACLALVMAFQSAGLIGELQLANKSIAMTDWTNEDLALAWAQAHATDHAVDVSDLEIGLTIDEPAVDDAAVDDAEEAAPSWLLLAVAHDSAYDELEN